MCRLRLKSKHFPTICIHYSLTNDEHLSGLDECVEGGVSDDLAAVGPAVHKVHFGQEEGAAR